MTLENRVMALVAEQLGVARQEVSLHASLIDDLGADSLDIVELVMAIEDAFDIEISESASERIGSIGEAVLYLEEQLGAMQKPAA